jgi:hypothetical protein
LLLLLSATALAGLAVVVGVIRLGDRKWEEMERKVRELQAEFEARSCRRPPLRAGAEPGNATADYEKAALPLASVNWLVSGSPIRTYLGGEGAVDAKEVESILGRYETSLELFRRAGRKEMGQALLDWGRGGIRFTPSLLVCLVEARARLYVDSGRYREGMDLFLDMAQLGGDVARNGDVSAGLAGLNIQGTAFHGLKGLLVAGRLGSNDVMEMSRALEVLDQSFPSASDALINDLMLLGITFQNTRSTAKLRSAYTGFEEPVHPLALVKGVALPDRLLMANAFLFEFPLVQHAIEADRLPWSQARAIHSSIDEEIIAAHSSTLRPVYGSRLRGVSQIPRDFRERRAQLRLLRAAAHFAATGEVQALSDPFGSDLRYRQEGSALIVWSVGPDGVDDHGDARREKSWRPAPDAGRSKDLVLTVHR